MEPFNIAEADSGGMFSVRLNVCCWSRLLVSLVLDIIPLVDPTTMFNPVIWSQNFLFASLALFCCLFLLFVHSFGTELSARMESTRPPETNEQPGGLTPDRSGGVMTDEELQSQWPGIKCAYDLVLPSYQWMMARL